MLGYRMATRGDLNPEQAFHYLTNDFESLWECMAGNQSPEAGRGNFAFALHAMVFLEWCSRLCAADPSGEALTQLSDALVALEPRYFARLPSECQVPKSFQLPTQGEPSRELIALIFDLIRNGQAHQYQQQTLVLPSGEFFGISLSGAAPGNSLKKLRDGYRPPHHLGLLREGRDGELGWLVVDPGMIYFDIRTSAEQANLIGRSLEYPFLRADPNLYQFSLDELQRALGIDV